MARHQYRLSGKFNRWTSAGAAALAVANLPGSGKVVTIRSCEIEVTTFAQAGTPGGLPLTMQFALARCSAVTDGAEVVTPMKNDTNASDWPETIVCSLGATCTMGAVVRTYEADRRAVTMYIPTNMSQLSNETHRGSQSFRGLLGRTYSGAVERVTIRPGESFTVVPHAAVAPVLANTFNYPYRIVAVFRNQNTNRTFQLECVANDFTNSRSLFTIRNGSASTLIELVDLEISEIGGNTPPYFRAVLAGEMPVGSSDPARVFAPAKLDTDSPDLPPEVVCASDVMVQPLDSPGRPHPDDAMGSLVVAPYFVTRWNHGPTLRTFHADVIGHCGELRASDTFGNSQRGNDLLVRGTEFRVREGQTFAIVPAHGTISSAVAPQPFSGYSSFIYSITFDVEDDGPTFAWSPAPATVLAPGDVVTLDITDTSEHDDHLISFLQSSSGLHETVMRRAFNAPLPAVADSTRYTVTGIAIANGYRYTFADPGGWRTPFTVRAHAIDSVGRVFDATAFYGAQDLDRVQFLNITPAPDSTLAPSDIFEFDVIADGGASLSSLQIMVGYTDPSESLGVESFEVAAILSFGINPLPGYTATVDEIAGGFHLTIGRSGDGWLRPFTVFLMATDSGIPQLGLEVAYQNNLFAYDVAPVQQATDHDPPTSSVVSPTVGTELAPTTPVVFDVVDDSGTFRRVIVALFYPATGITELVHDGDTFLGKFVSGARVMIANGFRYTVLPIGGWTSAPTIRIFAIDRTGKEL